MITLVADLGGTRMKLGIVKDRVLLARDCLPARSREGLSPQLPRIVRCFEHLCAGTGMAFSDCTALGVAFPSLVDVEAGSVLNTYGKYTDAPQIDLPGWANAQFGLRLVLENDARAAQLGEWKAGAGLGCDDFVMVTLGTGLGTSAIVAGQMLRGKHGQAAVLGGHMTVRQAGRQCICGNRGCAETEASAAALPRIAREHPQFESSALRSLAEINYEAVFRLAREQDACAIALRDYSIEVWSALIVNLIHTFDPERVVVGGGITTDGDCIAYLERSVHARAHTPWGEVKILPAKLGDDAALIGADFLVRERASGWGQ